MTQESAPSTLGTRTGRGGSDLSAGMRLQTVDVINHVATGYVAAMENASACGTEFTDAKKVLRCEMVLAPSHAIVAPAHVAHTCDHRARQGDA